jgi:hypothetical protein
MKKTCPQGKFPITKEFEKIHVSNKAMASMLFLMV